MLIQITIDLMDDEEEVLLALAETLNNNFLDFVGGPAHALHVIKILEKLCQMDESTVRDKATESIKKIFGCLKLKEIEPHVMDIIKRLMNGETY
jgi:serine/threonine-protein phosphatase 2A regulatory subunit A